MWRVFESAARLLRAIRDCFVSSPGGQPQPPAESAPLQPHTSPQNQSRADSSSGSAISLSDSEQEDTPENVALLTDFDLDGEYEADTEDTSDTSSDIPVVKGISTPEVTTFHRSRVSRTSAGKRAVPPFILEYGREMADTGMPSLHISTISELQLQQLHAHRRVDRPSFAAAAASNTATKPPSTTSNRSPLPPSIYINPRASPRSSNSGTAQPIEFADAVGNDIAEMERSRQPRANIPRTREDEGKRRADADATSAPAPSTASPSAQTVARKRAAASSRRVSFNIGDDREQTSANASSDSHEEESDDEPVLFLTGFWFDPHDQDHARYRSGGGSSGGEVSGYAFREQWGRVPEGLKRRRRRGEVGEREFDEWMWQEARSYLYSRRYSERGRRRRGGGERVRRDARSSSVPDEAARRVRLSDVLSGPGSGSGSNSDSSKSPDERRGPGREDPDDADAGIGPGSASQVEEATSVPAAASRLGAGLEAIVPAVASSSRAELAASVSEEPKPTNTSEVDGDGFTMVVSKKKRRR